MLEEGQGLMTAKEGETMPNRLRVERLGDLAVFTLSYVQRANALDDRLLLALREAIHDAAASGARVGVLTGAGRVFCAGYDLHALPSSPSPEWLRGHGELEETLRLLREGPLPMVAALSGPAIGAGLELALSCDLRVAHKEVIVQMPPVKLGIVYTLEGLWRLVTLCGAARTRELLLLAQPLLAETAHEYGLISRIVEASEVLETAMTLARQIAAQPPAAIHGTRQLLEHLLQHGPMASREELERLLGVRQSAWESPEGKNARAQLQLRVRSAQKPK